MPVDTVFSASNYCGLAGNYGAILDSGVCLCVCVVCLQIGTGYFGCRNNDTGGFDPEKFKAAAARPQVKMIEIKLSQGAKPSHGGILPAAKISPAIAEARGIPSDRDCNSPPHHAEFSTPRGLLDFVARLRVLSDGKPIGVKLCVGHPVCFTAVCCAIYSMCYMPCGILCGHVYRSCALVHPVLIIHNAVI